MGLFGRLGRAVAVAGLLFTIYSSDGLPVYRTREMPTVGVPTSSPSATKGGYTLVVVDFNAPDRLDDTERIGYVIDRTIERGMPVVTVESGSAWTTNEPYRSRLQAYPRNTFIEKTTPDAFNGTNLEQTLQRSGNNNLVIVGGIGEVCVTSTARTAIDRGYEVHLSDETSINNGDSIYERNSKGERLKYPSFTVTVDDPLAEQPVNSYRGVNLWNRSSDTDYRRLLNLVEGR